MKNVALNIANENESTSTINQSINQSINQVTPCVDSFLVTIEKWCCSSKKNRSHKHLQ